MGIARIRLMRFGKTKSPQYRVVLMSSRSSRDGRALEYLGYYHPLVKDRESDNFLKLKVDNIVKKLNQGARPTDTVAKLLLKKGVNHPFLNEYKNKLTKKINQFKAAQTSDKKQANPKTK